MYFFVQYRETTHFNSLVFCVGGLYLAVQLSKFDYRLSNKLETDLQKLRCRVNYHALTFTEPNEEDGKALCCSTPEYSTLPYFTLKNQKLASLVLTTVFNVLRCRFEPDMLAFSGCYYGGGEKERKELGKIRKRWKTLHSNNPDKERRQGRCPLTLEEVCLMLRALGYSKDVHLYVASGEVYGGDETLAPLRALFLNIHSKDTIATKDELEPFSTFSSRMAALNFVVCDESDMFVTNNNGNMAKILAGRRYDLPSSQFTASALVLNRGVSARALHLSRGVQKPSPYIDCGSQRVE
ncbi:GDP-fucose protein O-fucosyltransferase [Tanacetum coccineum]|uniref:O-fucosyltransferase family protein n=1 Tax=Tanacetum coccineum TaxID=301880 RepID=A0ABQ5IHH7_9ASTR